MSDFVGRDALAEQARAPRRRFRVSPRAPGCHRRVSVAVVLDRIIEIARLSRVQLSIALTAFVLTLALAPHVEWAIIAASALSVAIHPWRELRLDLTSSSDGDRLESFRKASLVRHGSAA